MAGPKKAGKPAVLSEEYVVDSSDEDEVSPETPTDVHAEPSPNEVNRDKEPTQESEPEDSEDAVPEAASPKQAAVSSPSKESTPRKRKADDRTTREPATKRTQPQIV